MPEADHALTVQQHFYFCNARCVNFRGLPACLADTVSMAPHAKRESGSTKIGQMH